MIQLTGFADEASRDLDRQIQATRDIGWTALSARMVGSQNIHDLPDDEFARVADRLDDAGIHVPEFGSLIGNWAKSIDSDFALTLAEIDRAIPRMHRLGTKLVRIMSYAQRPWGQDQSEAERFRRLREIVTRFEDADLIPLHENCMNWGGFSAEHTLRLLEEVPGLQLVFDTGNPVFQRDRTRPAADGSFPWQDPLEFWEKVRDHVAHIHIKDAHHPAPHQDEPTYTMPGQGHARLRHILADAKSRGYTGWIAIEPHVATVFHAPDPQAVDWDQCYASYVDYGKRFEALLHGA